MPKPFLFQQAEDYAIRLHSERYQLYDNKPYSFHLNLVVQEANEFVHILQNWDDIQLAIAGCWVHDVIEDCGVTYNDVKRELNEAVAEISYLLETPKGRGRRDRHGDPYYMEIATNRIATFVKLCDRLANVRYSRERQDQTNMYSLYQKEQPHFAKFLRPAWPEFEPMWVELIKLLTPDRHPNNATTLLM